MYVSTGMEISELYEKLHNLIFDILYKNVFKHYGIITVIKWCMELLFELNLVLNWIELNLLFELWSSRHFTHNLQINPF